MKRNRGRHIVVPQRYRVVVRHNGVQIGTVYVTISGDTTHASPNIPEHVLSDIRVTYIRDRVVFGKDAQGYEWLEE